MLFHHQTPENSQNKSDYKNPEKNEEAHHTSANSAMFQHWLEGNHELKEPDSLDIESLPGAVQKKETKEDGKEEIQLKQAPSEDTKETSGGNYFPAPIQKQPDNEQAKTAGPANQASMPEDVQAKMEYSFGTSFSSVNVHTNDNSASDMGALAYTRGNNIHFAPGQYNPTSSKGQELLGHELTHVVQQRQGRVQPTKQGKGLAVNDSPSLENEADVMGKKAAEGKKITQNTDVSIIQNKKDENGLPFTGTPSMLNNDPALIAQMAKKDKKKEEPPYYYLGNVSLYTDACIVEPVNNIRKYYRYRENSPTETYEIINKYYSPILNDVECIGYGTINKIPHAADEPISFLQKPKAYILKLNRSEWEEVKKRSTMPIIYDSLIYPFMQAAVGEFPYQDASANLPLQEDVVAPFIEAFYGIDYYKNSGDTEKTESKPLDFPENHAFENHKGDAVSKFIARYQSQIISHDNTETMDDDLKEFVKDMHGDKSVHNNGLDALNMMFSNAYLTASKRIIEYALIDRDSTGHSAHHKLITEIQICGAIMSGVFNGYHKKISEIQEKTTGIFDDIWDNIPFSKFIPSNYLTDKVMDEIKNIACSAVVDSITKAKRSEKLEECKTSIMDKFRINLIADFDKISENAGQGKDLEFGISKLHSRFNR